MVAYSCEELGGIGVVGADLLCVKTHRKGEGSDWLAWENKAADFFYWGCGNFRFVGCGIDNWGASW